MNRSSTLRAFGATLAAGGLLMASVSMASAQGETQGTCASIGSFTENGSCTVLAGETVFFVIESGAGGVGGSGWSGSAPVAGGPGGAGGRGGLGGAGVRVAGSFTASVTSTLDITVGANGAPGIAGPFGIFGTNAIPSGGPSNGGNGGSGQPGTNGEFGLPTSIALGGQDLVRAGAGTGGQGGTEGTGGLGGNGVDNLPGDPGELGVAGNNGFPGALIAPESLPEGWELLTATGTPGVTFSGDEPEPTTTTTPGPTTTTLPPGELVTPRFTG